MFDHDDGFDALEAGAAYAFYRHGQDAQTAEIVDAMNARDARRPIEPDLEDPHQDAPEAPQPINALDFSKVDMPEDLDDYIGQEPLKRQVVVHMKSAQVRGQRFPHTLFASGYPGVGKTTMARLVAKMMGVDIFELVPPFSIETLVAAAQTLDDKDILFVDEIHKLSDNGGKGSEILLKVLEDGVAFVKGEVIELNDITIIGATTEPDKLLAPVLDRFKLKPYFEAYSWGQLSRIAINFAFRHRVESVIDDQLAVDIAAACRNTPRIIEEMVLAARALFDAYGQPPTTWELLTFLEVEPDGLTRTHIHYLTAMRQYFGRMTKDEEVEYIVGEAAIMQMLRETKPGIQRVEAFLVERGLIDRTPRGRRLTARGIARAEEFIRAGKGAANVA